MACQLDLLLDCVSVRDLRQALESLPKTLDDTYARILLNIDKQYNHYYRHILKIMQWLTFSARPLQLEELAEIVAIDTDETPRFDPERRWPEPRDILMMCSSLVTSTEGAKAFVRLAHFSVKEYLVSNRIQFGIAARYSIQEIESHGVLAKDCIAYLLQHHKPRSLPEPLGLSPLAPYAAEYWTDHARQAQKGPVRSAARLSMELLMSGEGGLLNWVRIADPDSYGGYKSSRLEIGDLASPLYYASLIGLSEPVNMMIERNLDVNAEGGRCRNALQAALVRGNTAIAQVLLDKGADIDAVGRFGTVLCVSCSAGYYEIAELLLNKGADVDAYGEGDFDHGTALQIASKHGYENIVKLLLDRDAGVNATSRQNAVSSLEIALLKGHETIVKMLLDKGADVDIRIAGISVLQSASWNGHENLVKMLLDKGANVGTQRPEISALQSASLNGHEDIVKMLLEKGADVNAYGRFASAVQLASEKGHENVVKVLLDRGADVNATSRKERRNALQLASMYDDEKILEMLMDRRIPANAINIMSPEKRRLALRLGSRKAFGNIVKMLLAKGAVMPEEDTEASEEEHGPSGEHARDMSEGGQGTSQPEWHVDDPEPSTTPVIAD